MQAPTPLEKEILDDVKAKTGLSFRLLGGIDTRDRRIAEAVLPVLANWVPKVRDNNHRHALYACFHSPHAYAHMDQLIDWWQNERFSLALSSLTQTLTDLAKPQDAERLWRLCQQFPSRPFRFHLLAKLATLPSRTRAEVRDSLVMVLQDGASLTLSDLSDISKVDDPRIRSWFQGQLNSANKHLRQLAKRVVDRRKRLPKGLAHSAVPPDKSIELFSTEVDLEASSSLLRQIGSDLGLKMPPWIQDLGFLSAATIDHWLTTSIPTKQGTIASLWFRLEDTDTVEIVVTPGTARSFV
jgi:hypothetical protein